MLKIEYNIRLKEKIEALGLKQIWLAKQIGVDSAVMTGFVRGYRIPTEAQALGLAQVLECTVEDIF